MPKNKFGVTINGKMTKELDKIVEVSVYLNLSRSEVVEAILTAFFKTDMDHAKKAENLSLGKEKSNYS